MSIAILLSGHQNRLRSLSAPTARNVIAWAIGPGGRGESSRALKARNALAFLYSGRYSYFAPSALFRIHGFSPGALPQAFTFRAVGAEPLRLFSNPCAADVGERFVTRVHRSGGGRLQRLDQRLNVPRPVVAHTVNKKCRRAVYAASYSAHEVI